MATGTRRGETMDYADQLVTEQCCACSVWFAVPYDFQRRKVENHSTFYCPNGHGQSYNGPSQAEKNKRRALAAEAQETFLRDQLAASERSNRALKGVVTRTKRRVGKGVCPCCSRTFGNVAAHMANKHPEYAESP